MPPFDEITAIPFTTNAVVTNATNVGNYQPYRDYVTTAGAWTLNDGFITRSELKEELDKFGRKLIRTLNELKHFSVEISEDEVMELVLGEGYEDH